MQSQYQDVPRAFGQGFDWRTQQALANLDARAAAGSVHQAGGRLRPCPRLRGGALTAIGCLVGQVKLVSGQNIASLMFSSADAHGASALTGLDQLPGNGQEKRAP